MKLLKTIFGLFLVLAMTSCDPEDATVDLSVPSTYAFTRAGVSTVAFSGQTARLKMGNELSAALKDETRTLDQLDNMFTNPAGAMPFADAELNESSKSIRSKVAASRDLFNANATLSATIRADFDRWITGQVEEVFPRWNELAAPGQAGQIAEGTVPRYINHWGLEYNEAVIKGLIGALIYDQMANHYLSPAVLDEGTNRSDNDAEIVVDGEAYTNMEHKWDEAYGYLFGGAGDPSDGLADLGAGDVFLNKYLGRVEGDADYAGIAEQIETALRVGRAAIVAGDYAERDRQAAIVKEKIRDVIAIRAVYYLKQGEINLRATPPAYGAAFHDLSEGYGFIYSLQFVAEQGQAQPELVEDYLRRLRNAEGEGWWDIDPAVLANLAEEIASKFALNVNQAGS